ncbi:hypothetical protein Mapa_006401 [Marchantia paleacea]|nr:hypothetical protein Mapa_006401 [Marchantia paleacea]
MFHRGIVDRHVQAELSLQGNWEEIRTLPHSSSIYHVDIMRIRPVEEILALVEVGCTCDIVCQPGSDEGPPDSILSFPCLGGIPVFGSIHPRLGHHDRIGLGFVPFSQQRVLFVHRKCQILRLNLYDRGHIRPSCVQKCWSTIV